MIGQGGEVEVVVCALICAEGLAAPLLAFNFSSYVTPKSLPSHRPIASPATSSAARGQPCDQGISSQCLRWPRLHGGDYNHQDRRRSEDEQLSYTCSGASTRPQEGS